LATPTIFNFTRAARAKVAAGSSTARATSGKTRKEKSITWGAYAKGSAAKATLTRLLAPDFRALCTGPYTQEEEQQP